MFFENYGPSARDCYHYCEPNDLKSYDIDVRGKVNGMSWDLITEILISHPADVIMDEDSHKVLLIEPQPDDRSASRTTIISGTVSQLLWERDSYQQWRNHRKLFMTLLRVSDAKGLCRKFFEPAFHALFIRGAKTRLIIYPMALQPGGTSIYTFTVPEFKSGPGSGAVSFEVGRRRRLPFDFDKENNPITSLDPEHYYLPMAHYPSLDSFVYGRVYHRGWTAHEINLFQVTVAKNHDLVSKGVREVHELGQRLGIDLKIRIVVVLFGNVEVEFKAQKELYDDWGLQAYVVQMTEAKLYQIQ